ncbi:MULTISPECIES: DMT family transporter [unclassified Pseudoclavibacter]|uniref:DMT family transporter n=1 Tax=unclassified Pseudoclavibacter TaxID=2615177 RepID=UPI001BADCAD7|nr:EamA family transporter [Pseudoclavibacter sp. Marseille-Q4354]MBS3179742.1 EamA family transporter [Pseudoclavibacter sp. Marseille-Q4354]
MVPLLLVLLAAVCFGTTGTAQALGAPEVSAFSLGSARLAIGGTLLGAWALFAVRHRRGARGTTANFTPDAARLRRPNRAHLGLISLGALGVLLYQPLFFAGTAGSGVAVGTVLALGSAPVLTGLLQWALERRFPGLSWGVATAIAVLGVALIAAAGSRDAGGANLAGIAASIGAGASYSVYTLSAKALMNRGWSADGTMGVVFGVAGIVSVPLLLASGAEWMLTPTGLATAAWLGVVTTTIAYLCFGAGLAKLQAATVSTLTLAEPLTASILGLLVLREQLAGLEALGLIVLAAGIVVLVLGSTAASKRFSPATKTTLAVNGTTTGTAAAGIHPDADSAERQQQ